MTAERRDEPRFKTALEVQLQGINVSTNNISMAGAQISCPGMHFEFLSAELASNAVTATIMLPDDRNVRCSCSTQYVNHYGSEYLIGLMFTGFEEDGEQILRDYLLESAGPEFVSSGSSSDQQ